MDDDQDDSQEASDFLIENTARTREPIVCQPAVSRRNNGSELLIGDRDLLHEGVKYGLKDDLKKFAKVLHKHGSDCVPSQFCQQFNYNLTAGVLLNKDIFAIVDQRYGRQGNQDEIKRPDACWEERHRIGSGAHGVCSLSQDIKTQQYFCSKQIHWSRFHSQEVLSPLILDHDGVVKILGLLLENHTVHVFMEFCDGDTLRDMIIKRLLPIEKLGQEQIIVTILIGLILVLQRMKKRGILHGDLHDGNVIVTKEGSIKVVDFGGSRDRNNSAVHPQFLGVADRSSLGRSGVSSSGGRLVDDVRSAFMLVLRLLLGECSPDKANLLRKDGSREEKLQALAAVENERLRAIFELAFTEDDPDLYVLETMLIQASAEIHVRISAQRAVESVAEVTIGPDALDAQYEPQRLTQIVPEFADMDSTPEPYSYLQDAQELANVMLQILGSIIGQQQVPESTAPSVLNEVSRFAGTVSNVSEQAPQGYYDTRLEPERADSEMSKVGSNDNSPPALAPERNYKYMYEVADDDETDFIEKIHDKRTAREAGSDASVIWSASPANLSAEDANMDSRYSLISHQSYHSQCSDAVERDKSVDVSGYIAALKGDVGSVGSGFTINGHELVMTRSNNNSGSVNYMQSSSAEDTVFTRQLSENLDVSSSSRELPSMLEGIDSAAAVQAIRCDDSVVPFPHDAETNSMLSDAVHGNSTSSDSALGVSVSSDSASPGNSMSSDLASGFRTSFNSARGMSSDSTFGVSMPLEDATATPVGMGVGESQSNDIHDIIMTPGADV